ncbi:MAG: hypothetical protein CMJ25_07990 [Phycisphaerae bacterium]|nr:hypothetical protein [Phycisphaerae bacterium]
MALCGLVGMMLPYKAQTAEHRFFNSLAFLTGDADMPNASMIQVGLIGFSMLATTLSGCKLMRNDIDSAVTAERLRSAPPIMGSTLEGRHLLVMQAPNPGWDFQIDRDDRGRDGWVVYITIREPNPAFMYPQRIVDKRLLSEIEADQPLQVMARLLAHGEKGDRDDYAPLTLVDSFGP